MDEAITRWINTGAGRSSVLDAIVIGIAVAGVPLMVLAVVGLWWSRSRRTHLRQVAVEAGLSTLGGLAFNQIVLLFLHRPRPYVAGVSHLIVAPSADWSFPSDHATVAFAIAATLLYPTNEIAPFGFSLRQRWWPGPAYLSALTT
jgi:undecaprenyl-diphosphatase